MTQEQYEHWKDFARRMVNVAVSARAKSPSRADVLEVIEFFFECRMDPDDEWSRVKSWDHTAPDKGERYATCCGDHMSEIAEYHVPGYWGLPDGERGQRKIDRWMDPVHCCVRAGLGAVIDGGSGMGVAGFTAGDIRKMFPEGVPEWAFGGKAHRWNTQKITGVVPGIGYTMGESVPNGTFEEMPNDAAVWL